MKFNHYLLCMCMIVLVFLAESCKKKKKESPIATKTELITSKSWIYSSLKFSPAIRIESFPIPISDIYPFMQACTLDNFMTFKSDHTFISDEGTLKCDTTVPQTTSGTWSLNPDETKIVFSSFNGFEEEVIFDLIELTYEKFSFRYIINGIGDLAPYMDTTGLATTVTIEPGTKFTITMVPK